MISDYEQYPVWMVDMLCAEVVSREEARTVCKFGMGGLVKINYTLEFEEREYDSIRFRMLAGDMKHYQGQWVLVCQSGKDPVTSVTYSMELDPGLPLPDWIVKRAATRQLSENLLALKRRAESMTPAPACDAPGEIATPRGRSERILEVVRRGSTIEIWFKGDRYSSNPHSR